jgi:serine/threonine-protein kinase
MTPERWQLVEALFEQAAALPVEQRGLLLAQRCKGDADLLREVTSLLAQESAPEPRLLPRVQSWQGPASSDPVTLVGGSHFGPYVILRLLGVGGMGEVYLAEDSRLQRKVALKLLAGWLDPDERLMRRFTTEALSASALNHPNIPVVYETGEFARRRFIASEFVDGIPLSERLRQGPLNCQEALPIVRQVAEALRAAHAAGIVHRDVKPGNILLRGDGTVKLVDFGIAKFSRPTADFSAIDSAQTVVGMVIGTPGYMPPEQALGEAVDARSDLWSLTAVLHEMLFGKRPSASRTGLENAAGIPSAVLALVERGLQSDPADRFQNADAWLAALAASTLLPAPRRWWRRPTLRIAAALFGVALLAATAALLGRGGMHGGARPSPSLAVLRFDNLPPGEANGYITAGLQEEVLTHLARISGLKVLSPHAVAGLTSHPERLQTLGATLGVGAVLEGSVAVQGERVRVSVELIDTQTSAQLWAESYDRELRDVFDVERDIAERVALQLRATLLPAEKAEVQVADTRNPEAHAALLMGHFFLARGDEASLRKALEKLKEATRLDSDYAQAYAEQSIVWFNLESVSQGPELVRVKAQARSAAQHAIELSPNLPEAHVALGWVFLAWDWDLRAAEHEFSSAVRLAPNSARAKNGLGTLYAYLAQFDRAALLIQQARDLDPLNSSFVSNLGFVRFAQRRTEDAEKLYRAALELEPGAAGCHFMLARLALERGAMGEALREAQAENDPATRDFAVALIDQVKGDAGRARTSLEAFIAKYQSESPFQVAELYAVRGEADRAFQWLDRAYDARDGGTVELLPSRLFTRLYGDARFSAFCTKFGVPPPARTPKPTA